MRTLFIKHVSIGPATPFFTLDAAGVRRFYTRGQVSRTTFDRHRVPNFVYDTVVRRSTTKTSQPALPGWRTTKRRQQSEGGSCGGQQRGKGKRRTPLRSDAHFIQAKRRDFWIALCYAFYVLCCAVLFCSRSYLFCSILFAIVSVLLILFRSVHDLFYSRSVLVAICSIHNLFCSRSVLFSISSIHVALFPHCIDCVKYCVHNDQNVYRIIR